MLSKALRNCSKIFYRCSKQSQEVWQESETLYHPKNPIAFENGKCMLFENESFGQAKIGYLILFGLGAGLITYSAKKLYNYQDRRWYGILFYLALIGFVTSQSIQVSGQFSKLVITLHLLQDGRTVILTHPNRLSFSIQKHIDIAKISRPQDINEHIYKMQLVFPVVFNSQLFYLQRDPEYIVNKEILPVVMNAKYIKID